MEIVDDFFDAHAARLGPHDEADAARHLAEQGEFHDLYRVTHPGFDDGEVTSALEKCGFGAGGTEVYRAFLSAGSYQALDCDGLIEFAATSSLDAWLEDVTRFRGRLDPSRFFAFGFDPATSAVFCLHREHFGREPVVSVVDEETVLHGAFSSFPALLRVLSRALRSTVMLHVERGASPSIEQRDLVALLRDLDPEGFGRVGWPEWYQRAVGWPGLR